VKMPATINTPKGDGTVLDSLQDTDGVVSHGRPPSTSDSSLMIGRERFGKRPDDEAQRTQARCPMRQSNTDTQGSPNIVRSLMLLLERARHRPQQAPHAFTDAMIGPIAGDTGKQKATRAWVLRVGTDVCPSSIR